MAKRTAKKAGKKPDAGLKDRLRALTADLMMIPGLSGYEDACGGGSPPR